MGKLVSIYRIGHFNAAHRLHNKSWSDEKNKEIFGLCNNPNYHGHNYKFEVKVSGEIDAETGYVIDTKVLKEIIKEEVEDRYDHKNLNLDLPEFANVNTTVENIAVAMWDRLRMRLDRRFELTIKLYETERNIAEYNGK